jgi:hypothetical protein
MPSMVMNASASSVPSPTTYEALVHWYPIASERRPSVFMAEKAWPEAGVHLNCVVERPPMEAFFRPGVRPGLQGDADQPVNVSLVAREDAGAEAERGVVCGQAGHQPADIPDEAATLPVLV